MDNKNKFDLGNIEERFTRDFFMSYDWPFFLNMVCEAREVPKGEKLPTEEFNALTHAANVTPQMSGFDWDKFIQYVQNVRDYFAFRGCNLKKVEETATAGMNESFKKALLAMYVDLRVAANSLQFEKRFTEEELRIEVIAFVARLVEKGYVFA